MAQKNDKAPKKLARDPHTTRLGIKRFAGQAVQAGEVLVRQRGTKWRPGENVTKGGDDTLNALISGVVSFTRKGVRRFNGNRTEKTFIHVLEPVKAKSTPKTAVK
jgi:large subunit ribosomal protein L27